MDKEIKETIDKLCKQVEEQMKQIAEQDISSSNIEYLSKLVDIKENLKEMEEKNMYGNYGRGYGANFDNYRDGGRDGGRGMYSRDYSGYGRGNSGNYGARGYDRKYRGDESIERMSNEYGRYMENRERYGASEETMKSLEFMLHSMEDFAKMLKEDAESPEEVEMIRHTGQKIAQM